MPKSTNKRRNVNRSNEQDIEQEAQEQVAAVDNSVPIDSVLGNVLPPRLLKKLRRIPRLAELERMFDEPSSSSEDNINSIISPNSPQNTESSAQAAGSVSSSSNIIIHDDMPSTSNGAVARPEPAPTSDDTGNNNTCDANVPNNNNVDENLMDLTSDNSQEVYVVNKSTNTIESFSNKFHYRGHMCVVDNININESDDGIHIYLSVSQIKRANNRSKASILNAILNNRSVVQSKRVNSVKPRVSVGIQTDAECRHLHFNSVVDMHHSPRRHRPNVAKLSIKSGKYLLNICPPSTNSENGNVHVRIGDEASENNSNYDGVEVSNWNRFVRPNAGEILGDCPICLEKLSSSDLASTLCGHVFCLQCITAVVNSGNKRCPTCRANLTKKSCHEIYL